MAEIKNTKRLKLLDSETELLIRDNKDVIESAIISGTPISTKIIKHGDYGYWRGSKDKKRIFLNDISGAIKAYDLEDIFTKRGDTCFGKDVNAPNMKGEYIIVGHLETNNG